MQASNPASYHMYQSVYYHKTIIGFGLLLQRIYEELAGKGLVYKPNEVLKLQDEEAIYDYNDSCLIHAMSLYKKNGEDDYLAELISYFKRRKHLKLIG